MKGTVRKDRPLTCNSSPPSHCTLRGTLGWERTRRVCCSKRSGSKQTHIEKAPAGLLGDAAVSIQDQSGEGICLQFPPGGGNEGRVVGLRMHSTVASVRRAMLRMWGLLTCCHREHCRAEEGREEGVAANRPGQRRPHTRTAHRSKPQQSLRRHSTARTIHRSTRVTGWNLKQMCVAHRKLAATVSASVRWTAALAHEHACTWARPETTQV